MRQRGFAMLFGPATAYMLALLLSPTPASAEAQAPTLAKDVQPIFDMACTDCHGARKAKAKLSLAAGPRRPRSSTTPPTRSHS